MSRGTGVTASPSTLEESRERLGEPRQSGGGFPVRKVLSVQAQVELAERLKAERPGYRLGDQVHGPWCDLIHEENRWWEAFNSALNPACRSWLRSADQVVDTPSLAIQVHRAADIADGAVAEAKKRGRL